MKRHILILSVICLLSGIGFGQDSKLKDVHSKVLKNWLTKDAGWRLATLNDYDQGIVEMGIEAEGKNFAPFYAAADFNHDEKEDFAVVLVGTGPEKKYAAAIFNAPFDPAKKRKPTFLVPNLQAGDGVFFINQLLIGPYASDNIFIISPVCDTYKIEIPEFGDQ